MRTRCEFVSGGGASAAVGTLDVWHCARRRKIAARAQMRLAIQSGARPCAGHAAHTCRLGYCNDRIAVVGEMLSGSVQPFGATLGLSYLFLGVVILPVAGAISEVIICRADGAQQSSEPRAFDSNEWRNASPVICCSVTGILERV